MGAVCLGEVLGLVLVQSFVEVVLEVFEREGEIKSLDLCHGICQFRAQGRKDGLPVNVLSSPSRRSDGWENTEEERMATARAREVKMAFIVKKC